MKIIKEDIANLERAIENDRVNMVGSMPIVMADAVYESEKTQEKIDKEMKDHVKKTKVDLNKVIGAGKQPVPEMPVFPKSNLDESLFEDYNNVRKYSDMLSDMIDNGIIDVNIVAEYFIDQSSEDDIKRFMEVNDIINYEDEDEFNESCKRNKKLKESKKSSKKYKLWIPDYIVNDNEDVKTTIKNYCPNCKFDYFDYYNVNGNVEMIISSNKLDDLFNFAYKYCGEDRDEAIDLLIDSNEDNNISREDIIKELNFNESYKRNRKLREAKNKDGWEFITFNGKGPWEPDMYQKFPINGREDIYFNIYPPQKDPDGDEYKYWQAEFINPENQSSISSFTSFNAAEAWLNDNLEKYFYFNESYKRNRKLREALQDDNTRKYSDMLSDMIDNGIIDVNIVAEYFIDQSSEDDIKRFMILADLIDDEEDISETLFKDESLNEGRKKEDLDLWAAVYEELSCDIGFKGSNRKISSKEFPNRLRFRFDDEYAFEYNDGPGAASKKDVRNAVIGEDSFILNCKDKNQLEFAKKVADAWGVDFENNGLKAVITIPEDSIDSF